jgi:hypothetical protein
VSKFKRWITGAVGTVVGAVGVYLNNEMLIGLGAAIGGLSIPWPEDARLRNTVRHLLDEVRPPGDTPVTGSDPTPSAKPLRVRRETIDQLNKLLNGKAKHK